jgi:hypothetical protein
MPATNQMLRLRYLYMQLFLWVFALYAYFNKGIAYSFMAEGVLFLGLILLLVDLKNYVIPFTRSLLYLLIFLIVAAIAVLVNLPIYPVFEIAQDAAVFIYPLFVLILFLFIPFWSSFVKGITTIYAVYPFVAFISLQISIHVPSWVEFSPFNGVSLLLVKFGDMAVHLLFSSLLLLSGHIKVSKRMMIVYVVVILYLLLMIATFTRGGILAYGLGIGLFFWVYRKRFTIDSLTSYIRIFALIFFTALFFYLNTQAEENFQGRSVGLEQLAVNIKSVFTNDEEGALTDNKVWRLAWWYKIISDATNPKTALFGVGVGPNLSLLGEVDSDDESLRSPHNVFLTIMARFGVPLLLLWLVWVYTTLIKPLKSSAISEFSRLFVFVLIGALFNASFDVYLEGPMGGFLFWTLVGMLLTQDYVEVNATTEEALK